MVTIRPLQYANRPRWVYDDGGRSEAGYRGNVGDCVARAIAIATNQPYCAVYDALNVLAKKEHSHKRGDRSSARNGVNRKTYDAYLKQLGWVWQPTMFIGSGCRVHLRINEIPMTGPVIVCLSKHMTAIIEGIIHDVYNPSRDGTRCVYGYWIPPDNTALAVGAPMIAGVGSEPTRAT